MAYTYEGSDQELYKTNLYSGTDADLDNTAPVGPTDGFTSDINLEVNEYATIMIKFDGSGSTDNIAVSLFCRTDSTWDGDELAIQALPDIESDGSEDLATIQIGPHRGHGPGHYRLSLQSTGGTDTFDAHVWMRRGQH
jgi:hypothetical protein